PIDADRIVLACGGLTGGGVVYDPLDIHAGTDMAEKTAPPFRLGFDADAPPSQAPHLSAFGARLGAVSSTVGPAQGGAAWPVPGRQGLLEAVGVACDRDGAATPYLAAAGDAVADRPRTMLVAVQSGLRAGAWAGRA